MNISISSYVPDSTYFVTGDAEPTIDADNSGITIYDGRGKRRSWGTPGVTSTVVLDEDDFCAIHVGFHHKHGGGQFWRYYSADGVSIRQVTWAALPDELRQRVLDGYDHRAPSWAKAPGKLRTQYDKPASRKRTSYKMVRMDGDSLVSIYDGETVYTIGKRLAEAVGAHAGEFNWMTEKNVHDGGYYSHPTPEQVLALWNSGNLVPASRKTSGKYALVECEISGRIVEFPNGKLASTYLTPVAIIETVEE